MKYFLALSGILVSLWGLGKIKALDSVFFTGFGHSFTWFFVLSFVAIIVILSATVFGGKK